MDAFLTTKRNPLKGKINKGRNVKERGKKGITRFIYIKRWSKRKKGRVKRKKGASIYIPLGGASFPPLANFI